MNIFIASSSFKFSLCMNFNKKHRRKSAEQKSGLSFAVRQAHKKERVDHANSIRSCWHDQPFLLYEFGKVDYKPKQKLIKVHNFQTIVQHKA